jgi:putative transcriptional regulator
MNSSLREHFARLGPIRAIDRVLSGSTVAFVLHLPKDRFAPELKVIDAMFTLARRGINMLQAKRAIEALLDQGRISVELPTVEDTQAVVQELAAAGIAASSVEPAQTRDARRLEAAATPSGS